MEFIGVCLITRDLPRLVAFYSQLFHMAPPAGDVHVDIPVSGAGLSIYDAAAAERDMGLPEGASGSVALTVLVSDVDEEYRRLVGAGVPVLKPPCTHPWGSRSMQLKDPDGNLISLACRISE